MQTLIVKNMVFSACQLKNIVAKLKFFKTDRAAAAVVNYIAQKHTRVRYLFKLLEEKFLRLLSPVRRQKP